MSLKNGFRKNLFLTKKLNVAPKLRFVFSLNEHNLLFDEINEEQREEWRAWLWVVTAHIW